MTATVGIDPRIRDRRIAVARDVGHRRLRRLQAGVALVVGLVAAFTLTRSPLLDVDRVRVTGEAPDAAAVRAALDGTVGTPLTAFDTAAAAEAVAALPEVQEATVRRNWPGAVTVDVEPAVAEVAARASSGGWFLAAGDGTIIRAVDDLPEGLVVLADVVLAAEPGQVLPDDEAALAAVGAALPDDLVWRVSDLFAPGDGTAHARLIDGGDIVFAPTGDLDAMGVAASGVAATVPPGCVEQIDVVSSAAPALDRADGC